jgi:KDO2-lipid IV(A) lauroyltransferase
MKKKKKSFKTLAKKATNFLEAILAYAFYYILWLIPIRVSSSIGYFLGKTLIPIFSGNRKKVAFKNIALAFPEKTPKEVKEIFIKSCGYFGSAVLEMPRIKDNLKRVNFIDEHNILQTMKNAKTLVFSAHYGCWEIFSSRFEDIADMSYSIYKKPNNPYLVKFFANFRSNLEGMKLITLSKQKLVALNNEIKHKNISISMLVDQKVREGIKVDFFNRPAYTSTFLPIFALKHNLPLIPVHVVRRKNYMFDIILEKPISIEKTNNKEKDIETLTKAMNQKIEEWVQNDPTQWFWLHKRW